MSAAEVVPGRNRVVATIAGSRGERHDLFSTARLVRALR
jgi:hypothetical protein